MAPASWVASCGDGSGINIYLFSLFLDLCKPFPVDDDKEEEGGCCACKEA